MHIVFLSDIPWKALYQRPQQLAVRLARRWPILWVEPATLNTRPSFTPHPLGENITGLSVPAFPHNARQPAVKTVSRVASAIPIARKAITGLQASLVRRALRKAGTPGNQLGFFVQNFQLIGLAEHVSPVCIVFDYIDDAFGFTRFPEYVREEWKETIRRADLVTATSPTLRRQLEEAGAREVHLVSNGVEYARFAETDAPRPPDLPAGPLIGYIGSVYPWIDYTLLTRLAQALPAANLVMIGHAHPGVQGQLDELARLPNFRFLGSRPYEQMPAYVRHFSVAIIPFRKTPLTTAVNPVKLYEYSAAGIPTVTTDFSVDMQEFSHLIGIASSHDDFIARVRNTLESGARPDRAHALRAFARENDWDVRADRMIALMQHCLSHS